MNPEQRARRIIDKLDEFHGISCCGGDYCEHVGSRLEDEKLMTLFLVEEIVKERKEFLDALDYIHKLCRELEPKDAVIRIIQFKDAIRKKLSEENKL